MVPKNTSKVQTSTTSVAKKEEVVPKNTSVESKNEKVVPKNTPADMGGDYEPRVGYISIPKGLWGIITDNMYLSYCSDTREGSLKLLKNAKINRKPVFTKDWDLITSVLYTDAHILSYYPHVDSHVMQDALSKVHKIGGLYSIIDMDEYLRPKGYFPRVSKMSLVTDIADRNPQLLDAMHLRKVDDDNNPYEMTDVPSTISSLNVRSMKYCLLTTGIEEFFRVKRYPKPKDLAGIIDRLGDESRETAGITTITINNGANTYRIFDEDRFTEWLRDNGWLTEDEMKWVSLKEMTQVYSLSEDEFTDLYESACVELKVLKADYYKVDGRGNRFVKAGIAEGLRVFRAQMRRNKVDKDIRSLSAVMSLQSDLKGVNAELARVRSELSKAEKELKSAENAKPVSEPQDATPEAKGSPSQPQDATSGIPGEPESKKVLRLKKEVKLLKKQLSDLKTRLSGKTEEVQRLSESEQDLKRSNEGLASSIKKLSENNSSLKTQLENAGTPLKARIQELEANARKDKGKIQSLEDNLSYEKHIVEDLKGKLASAEAENMELKEAKGGVPLEGGDKFRLVATAGGRRRVFLPRATFEALISFGSVKVREFAHE
ncbi:MAG: hypothetical protein U0L04_01100 [Bacteroidaceae bacterium]|nr:hypothetical protein [Bacteroidaceae bacterium]